MQKVLVTGATGFIGNWVVEELLKLNVNVIATSTNTEKAKQFPWFGKVDYVPLDLKRFLPTENYFDFFHQPSHLIHLAWEGLPNYNSKFHLEENLPRHFAFLKNLVKNGLYNITVSGTCLEYGVKEGELKENDAVEPTTFYAQAKNELRIILEQMAKEKPLPVKWVRLFYMYGKGQSKNSLLSQLELAIVNNETTFNMSGGGQVRDFLPVQNVAEYIVKIAMQDKVTGIINCCSNQPVKVKDFVSKYLKEQNKIIHLNLGFYPYPVYEAMEFWGNNTKLKSILEAK